MKKVSIITVFLAIVICSQQSTFAQNAHDLFQKALVAERTQGDLDQAIQLYKQIIADHADDRALVAKALLQMGGCYEKLGKSEAQKAYGRIVEEYADQTATMAQARTRLAALISSVDNDKPLQPKFIKIRMPGSPGNGMVSPDGKKIAFISEGDVWVVPVSGGVNPYITGEPKRLTKNIGAWDMGNSFCWSGNGKWIAFNAKLESHETSIYVISSEGGDVQKVLVPSHYCGWPSEFRLSLSPDGNMLAYVSGWIDYSAITSKIYTIPVKGGDAKELTGPGTLEPVWSPDGTKIMYVKTSIDSGRNARSELLVIPAEGGTPKSMIKRQAGQIRGPVWSLDGNMIAYIKRPNSESPKEIWIAPVTNEGDLSGIPRKVDLPLESYHTIAGWTPDNKIGIQLMNPQYEVIYTVPSDGGIATQVTPQGWTSYPKWSPDGKRIFFRWDGGQIASVPSGGGAVDSIKIDSEFDIYTALPGSGNEVSPDGKTIVFSGTKHFQKDGKKQWEVDIFTVPVEGGKPTQLTEKAVKLQDRFPCWSPDGNSIAFIRPEIIDTKRFMHIYTISRNGENLKKITVKADDVAWAPIDWTPDGKSITFFTNKDSIRSIPVEGGESTLITKIDNVKSQFELAWSPSGEELAYTDKGKIWIFSKESGTSEKVKTGVKSAATNIGWSPDGKKIAFTAFAGGDTELWVMENFLPKTENAK